MTQQHLTTSDNQPLALHQDVDPILVMIQSAARDPDADVDKMERLMAMYERQQEKESIAAFNRDFVSLQNSLPDIGEGGQIIHGGKLISKYARWDEDINPVIKPILAANNFMLSFETDTKNGIHVTAHLIHASGHSRSGSFSLPPDKSGAKNEVQAIGSAVSYAKRYAAGPLLNLTTRGTDDDGQAAGNEADLIDESTQADINALIDEILTKPEQRVAFSGWLKTELKVQNGFVRNIPQKKAELVVEMLNKKKAAS